MKFSLSSPAVILTVLAIGFSPLVASAADYFVRQNNQQPPPAPAPLPQMVVPANPGPAPISPVYTPGAALPSDQQVIIAPCTDADQKAYMNYRQTMQKGITDNAANKDIKSQLLLFNSMFRNQQAMGQMMELYTRCGAFIAQYDVAEQQAQKKAMQERIDGMNSDQKKYIRDLLEELDLAK